MKLKLLLSTLITACSLGIYTYSDACCMAPKTYKGTISQNMHEAVLFHADGREELILGINYKLSPTKGEKLPETFAWVITVPNEPDQYALAERSLFKKTFEWADSLVTFNPSRGKDSKSEPAMESDQLILSKQVKVGPYTIQPIKAVGLSAIKGLNKWLDKNGFPQEDEAHMKYFIENNFTFLCVKINPAKTAKSVPGGGEIKPLHLSFASKLPYYPLKFSSRQGVFGVNVWMFTKKKIDSVKADPIFAQLNMEKARFFAETTLRGKYQRENVMVKSADFPTPLATLIKQFKQESITSNPNWNLNLLRSKAVNSKVKIANWKTDLFFPLVK